MKIYLTGEQIRSLSSFALGVSIESDKCEQLYCIETDVDVDGVREDFYVYDTDYPEEGGTILKQEVNTLNGSKSE